MAVFAGWKYDTATIIAKVKMGNLTTLTYPGWMTASRFAGYHLLISANLEIQVKD